MTSAESQPAVSVRQFVADSGSVTRGLRQGRTYTLTLNGEPLARLTPIMRRQAVPQQEALAIFATAPVIDSPGPAGPLSGDRLVTTHAAGVLDTSIIAAMRLHDPAELPDIVLITAVTLGELSHGPHA